MVSLTYNAQGRMASATVGNVTTTYVYNGKGERVAKKGRHVRGGMIYFAYDEAGRLIGEYDAQARPLQEIIYVDYMPVAVARNDSLYYVHADHLGTPRAITDTRDKIVWRWDSDAFGATATDEEPDNHKHKFQFNLRFPGQYYDKETNLHYNYYRDYDPSTGRYVQPDPIGLEGGLNIYAYADASPTMKTDPLGLATYMCIQPLHALGGEGARSGPDIWGNPLYHQYLCITDGKGGYTCGGQDQRGAEVVRPDQWSGQTEQRQVRSANLRAERAGQQLHRTVFALVVCRPTAALRHSLRH